MSYQAMLDPTKITIYFGHTRVSNEALDVDVGDDHIWYFDHAPVSTENLRLIGTVGGESEFIVNFDLEPISGTLTVDAALPAYDSIAAWYFYYVEIEDGADILIQDYRVEFPRLISNVDIFGQPHYQVHNNYPHKVSFKVVLTNEAQRNLLTEAMFYSYYFILIDKNIGATYGLRAYEGPIWSNEQGSIRKGASYLLPIELMVEQFGSYDADDNEITWGFYEGT